MLDMTNICSFMFSGVNSFYRHRQPTGRSNPFGSVEDLIEELVNANELEEISFKYSLG